eukprot:CAMPEP_0175438880 /NCGR_PEP_ID=MMETSP0095-20121207/56255_1 /TAXON_ID=311494 /ORGANISM="Alexandrium monilatum, Strain CCMP3105" /LENGTH=97 /DNA_ID=CAMNT_0016738681 /DNA_START=100 /DNA_END=390 /DNA_ORIENTATION=+
MDFVEFWSLQAHAWRVPRVRALLRPPSEGFGVSRRIAACSRVRRAEFAAQDAARVAGGGPGLRGARAAGGRAVLLKARACSPRPFSTPMLICTLERR